MSIASDTVTLFRGLWSDRFVDTCEIHDPVGGTTRGTINTSTLQYDAQATTVVYTGACLIRSPAEATSNRAEVYGQQAVTFTDLDVYLPWDAATVDLDQELTILTSAGDPELVNKVAVIRSIIRDSYITRRYLVCELDLGSGIGV